MCGCRLHSRRLFTGALLGAGASAAWPALAREGVDVGSQSKFSKIVPAEEIEAAAFQQYGQLKQEARQKNALVPESDPQVQRLRTIAQRLIPFSYEWNPRARDWKWEINLLNAKQVNAFCMPGGKIAFYTGILEELQLTDDEVSMVMGHEIAHALREHARERMGKNVATRGAIEIGAAIFGLGNGGRMAADIGGQLLTLRFGREDESEADLVGMELTARAGYDPRAGVSLWEKMGQASKGAPPEFLSTHPSGPTRIKEIQTALPQVTPLYARAPKPSRRFSPPPKR
ncbi:M48 family metallopeptidase [Rhizobacter sp. LjRoot28]|uniref:M48 family metallopeptidase n=1 Tax=Rhizobacter sp. LjRoot28 TaxID=3342309 RepID=UPI003ECCE83F